MPSTTPTDSRRRRPFLEPLEPRRLLAAGDVDPTFGDGGAVTMQVGEYSSVGDLVVLRDGAILAAVQSSEGTFIFRFLSDGSLDTAFGQGGRLPSGRVDLELLSDGDVLSIGEDGVRRHNPDWSLDAAFGAGGLIRTDAPVEDAAVQPDGMLLVVAGTTLTRYRADGQLDTAFGQGGSVVAHFRDLYDPEDRADHEFLIGVDVQPGGNIVVGGGITFDTETHDGRTGAADFAFARYLPDGQLDLSFGSLGRLTAYHHDHDAYIDDFAMLPDGGIVMAGGGLYGDGRTVVVSREGSRVWSMVNGQYEPRVAVRGDGTFAVTDYDSFAITEWSYDERDGLRHEFRVRPTIHEEDRYPAGYAIAYQPDGRVIAAGESSNHTALVRLHASPVQQRPLRPRGTGTTGELIEAENFDIGGEGVGYHDADDANRGNAYRSSGVDVGPTSDTGGGFAVGWTEPGEWLEYTIEIDSPGVYNILTRVANAASGASFHIELDGLDVTGSIAVPDTDSWHRSKTVASKPVHFAAGTHVLRLEFDRAAENGAVGNFNWLRLVHGLDVTFGEAGVVSGAYGIPLPQPEGTTIVVGGGRLVRLTADGTIDFDRTLPDSDYGATAAVLQPDGKILVAVTHNAAEDAPGLWRFNPDGTIDRTFGQDGFAASPWYVARLAVQPNGNILAGGKTQHPLFHHFFVRYTPDGTRDGTFAASFESDQREYIGADAAGRIYLVDYADGPCVVEENYGDLECPRLMFIRRLHPDGSADPSYGDNGITKVIRPESQLWARSPRFWAPQVLPNGTVVSGEMHLAYVGSDETSVITVPPNGAAEMTVHPEQHSDFTGTLLLSRFDGEFVLAGHYDPPFDDHGPYFSEDHYALIGGGPHMSWAHLRGMESIDRMAFTEDGGLLVSSGSGITRFVGVPPRQTPRSAAPWSVGSRIETEDFDDGGPGVSYNDGEPQNRGGSYRVSQVDVGLTDDDGGGYAVGWTQPGEWLEYTIHVPRDGRFDLDVRVANAASGGRFHVEIDGADVTGPMEVPDTGSFHRSATLTRSGIQLGRGTHVLRLAFDEAAANGAVGNFNWLHLKSVPRPLRPATRPELRRVVAAPAPASSATAKAPVGEPQDSESVVRRRRAVRPAPLW